MNLPAYKKISVTKKAVIYLTLFIAFCGWSSIYLSWEDGCLNLHFLLVSSYFACVSIIVGE